MDDISTEDLRTTYVTLGQLQDSQPRILWDLRQTMEEEDLIQVDHDNPGLVLQPSDRNARSVLVSLRASITQLLVERADGHRPALAAVQGQAVTREMLEAALHESSSSFSGNGEEIGTEEVAIMVWDAAEVVCAFLATLGMTVEAGESR